MGHTGDPAGRSFPIWLVILAVVILLAAGARALVGRLRKGSRPA